MTKILKLRKKQGISQAELSKYLGISRPTYILLEQGKKDITVKEAHILSKALNVNIWDLIGDIIQEIPDKQLEYKSVIIENDVKKLKQLLLEAQKIIQYL